jgi:hypothetical protein
MKIKLVFDAQFAGKIEKIVEVSNKLSNNQIKNLFIEELGIQFDDNCYYEIIT